MRLYRWAVVSMATRSLSTCIAVPVLFLAQLLADALQQYPIP
eukprot:COSAG02_NODE_50555_length_319_cov_8.104545_1_plen_41_part_01